MIFCINCRQFATFKKGKISSFSQSKSSFYQKPKNATALIVAAFWQMKDLSSPNDTFSIKWESWYHCMQSAAFCILFCDYSGNQSKQTKFWWVTVGVIHHFSDGPRLPSQRSEIEHNPGLSLVRTPGILASDWLQTLELSRASAVITKQENWQIQWEFHRESVRRVLKKTSQCENR